MSAQRPPRRDDEDRGGNSPSRIAELMAMEAPPPPETAQHLAGLLPPFRRAMDVLDRLGDTEDEWLVEDMARPGRWGILAAFEGDGKSRVRTQLALHVLDPKPGELALGMFRVPAPMAVCVVDMENGDREEARRDRELVDALGVDADTIRDRYIRLTQDDVMLSFANAAHVGHIARAIDQLHATTSLPALLVLDSADSLHDGPLWGQDLSSLKEALRTIRQGRPWLFVLLVAHLNKRGRDGRVAKLERELEDVAGNLTRQADVVILLDLKGPRKLRLAMRKRVRHQTVFLGRDEDSPVWYFVADAAAEPEATRSSKVGTAALVEHMAGGAVYNAKDVAERFDVHVTTARRALEAATEAGVLEREIIEGKQGRQSGHIYRVRVTGSTESTPEAQQEVLPVSP